MASNWRHTPNELRQYITLEPETGKLYWRHRGGSKRQAAWSKRFAHKKVFEWTDAKGYKRLRNGGTNYLSHRVVWALAVGEWPDGQIDHINGDRADNRVSNLRVVTASMNAKNRERKKGRTGKVGVVYYPKLRKWRAQIGVDNQKISLGYFDDFKKAVAARLDAEREYGFHKNHARYAPVTPVSSALNRSAL